MASVSMKQHHPYATFHRVPLGSGKMHLCSFCSHQVFLSLIVSRNYRSYKARVCLSRLRHETAAATIVQCFWRVAAARMQYICLAARLDATRMLQVCPLCVAMLWPSVSFACRISPVHHLYQTPQLLCPIHRQSLHDHQICSRLRFGCILALIDRRPVDWCWRTQDQWGKFCRGKGGGGERAPES